MRMAIDLSTILKPFENKWVALSEDYGKVLESGKSLKEVVEKCKKRECRNPIYFKVVAFDMAILPRSA